MNVFLIITAIMAMFVVFLMLKNTKTPSALGVVGGKLAPEPKFPNAVSSQTDDPEKQVTPFPFKGDLKDTKANIKQALQAYGNSVIESETEEYIHAVNTTPVLKFKDDLEFLFLEKEGIVHFRSASRMGYTDLGLNRKRYNRLLELYKAQ